MKTKLSLVLFAVTSSLVSAQWTKTAATKDVVRKNNNSTYYKLDINKIRTQLLRAQEVGGNSITVEIPTLNGKVEQFKVNSFPVMDKALAEKYQLGSYVGVGIDNPGKYIRFSVAPNDFQSMVIADGKYEFIEPASADKSVYSLHGKSSKSGQAFVCSTKEDKQSIAKMKEMMAKGTEAKASNKTFHTLRLAMSVTGEYTAYFGGTANALAQINATLSRVNGIFEQEFNIHLNMINAPDLIFTNAATDPYSDAEYRCKWNYELMNVLHGGSYGVSDASYDIGHLFGATGGGGNAGCIGCIGSDDVSYSTITNGCRDSSNNLYVYNAPNNYKGSAITSPSNGIPMGDNFDIDYVAHEFGHQLGDNHTFSVDEGFGVAVEPGSGSTIMGYAGLWGSQYDLQQHSDPYFHSVSIDQVQTNMDAVTVDVETPITNNPPIITPMPTTYTIPKSTAFVLTASATDPDGDALTYNWEQVNPSTSLIGISKSEIGNTTYGASFRSWPSTTSPTRYFPKLSTVLGGAVKNTAEFEAASTVARNASFRVTVRDNKPAGQAQTAYATQAIVVGSADAFTVNNLTLTPNANSTISWVVSGTTASPYNVANVKIDYTDDQGATWNVLADSVPNNGSASVFIPAAMSGKMIHVRVSAIDNVFYAAKQTKVETLGISEAGGTKSTVQIYPNPVDDILNVKNISPTSTYEIYNTPGQLVTKGTIGDGKIVVRDLVKGVYFITIDENGTTLKNKFVKK